MNDKLQMIIELSRDPILAAEAGRISCMNAAARVRFPKADVGTPARELIPEHILFEPSGSFFSSARIGGESFSVSALRDGDVLLLSLFPARSVEELHGCLSDSLMNGMMSALFNIGLSAERIGARLDLQVEELRKYYAVLNHNYHALNHRLSNLNTLCALTDGSMTVVPRNADLVQLCSELAFSVNQFSCGHAAHVDFSCAADALFACVDTPKVERLVLNLLSNAMKHTPVDGLIRLRLARSGSSAVISVDDNGCGISPEKLKTVFSGYENRLDEHNLTDPGTGGLGLGICRCIAERHGGAIILESRVGEGTSVRVLLPLSQPGGAILYSDAAAYENGGMNTLLTELCDILPAEVYGPRYTD